MYRQVFTAAFIEVEDRDIAEFQNHDLRNYGYDNIAIFTGSR